MPTGAPIDLSLIHISRRPIGLGHDASRGHAQRLQCPPLALDGRGPARQDEDRARRRQRRPAPLDLVEMRVAGLAAEQLDVIPPEPRQHVADGSHRVDLEQAMHAIACAMAKGAGDAHRGLVAQQHAASLDASEVERCARTEHIAFLSRLGALGPGAARAAAMRIRHDAGAPPRHVPVDRCIGPGHEGRSHRDLHFLPRHPARLAERRALQRQQAHAARQGFGRHDARRLHEQPGEGAAHPALRGIHHLRALPVHRVTIVNSLPRPSVTGSGWDR